MKLNRTEFRALKSLLRDSDMSMVNASMRLAVDALDPERQHAQLQSLGQSQLRRLIDLMPSGGLAKLHSPALHSVRHKAKKALLRLNRPHLDPDVWPKVYRMMTRMNVARGGLQKGSLNQVLKLNPKGMAVRLGAHTWDERNAAPLIIIGRWSDISKAISDAGSELSLKSSFKDVMAGDVNVEFDRMYGAMPGDASGSHKRLEKMPLFVSCDVGAAWQQTDDEGEVVLDSTRELVETGAGALTSLAGNFSQLNEIVEVVQTTADIYDSPLFQVPREAYSRLWDRVDMQPANRADRAIYTLTVGLGPDGPFSINTEKETLGGREFLKFASMAHVMATGRGRG